MKLKDILHEAIDFDTYLDRVTDKHLSGSTKVSEDEVYEVDFELFDENGDEIEISKSSDAPEYPDMVEIEVTGIESWNENPQAKHEDEEEIAYDYDNAEASITNSSVKAIDVWLDSRSDYSSITDYEYEIDFEKESGIVRATAVK